MGGPSAPGDAAIARTAVWTTPFALVCATTLATFTTYLMLNPILPLYVGRLGDGAAFVGITVAAFSVASILARPFMGSAVDRRGGGLVLTAGAGLLALASAAYLVPSTVVLLLARMVQGVGWAAVNTAGTTLAADFVPPNRRGEAMGWLIVFKALAATLAPAIGLTLVAAAGFGLTFVTATAVAGIALLLAALVARRSPRAVGIRRPLSVLDRSSAVPAVMLALVYAANPLVQVFVVLYAADRGIDGLPIYFVASGVVLIAVQPFARISDRFGRGPNMAVGLVSCALGLAIMGLSDDLLGLTLAGVLWSAGVGLIEPASAALAIDLAAPGRRGAAMATYTAAYQVGNAAGGVCWGFAIATLGFGAAFVGGITCIVAAAAVLWFRRGILGEASAAPI